MLVRTRQLDRNGAGGLPIAPEKGPNLRLANEFCRSAFPSRVRDACGPHGSSELREAAFVSTSREGARNGFVAVWNCFSLSVLAFRETPWEGLSTAGTD
jgi:hypothetical protein